MAYWHFDSWQQFFQMGKHGVFVWLSYAAVLSSFAITTILAHCRLTKALKHEPET